MSQYLSLCLAMALFLTLNFQIVNASNDDEEVIGIYIENFGPIAYPTRILNWHEVLNDIFNGTRFSVTWSPHSYSHVVVNTTSNYSPHTLGTSRKLYQSNLVVYDRATQTFWSQLANKAIEGPLEGRTLDIIPSYLTTWRTWKKIYPNSIVLKKPWYKHKNYYFNPFSAYYQRQRLRYPTYYKDHINETPIGFKPSKEVTLIVKIDDYNALLLPSSEIGLIHNLDWNSTHVLTVYSQEHKFSAAYNREIGSQIYIFEELAAGKDETSEFPLFRDTQTNSKWNMSGYCVEGALKDTQLDIMNSFVSFWFAAKSIYTGSPVFIKNALVAQVDKDCGLVCDEFFVVRWSENDVIAPIETPEYITAAEFDNESPIPWDKLTAYIVIVSFLALLLVSMVIHYFAYRRRRKKSMASIVSIASVDDGDDIDEYEFDTAVAAPSSKKNKKKVSFELQEFSGAVSIDHSDITSSTSTSSLKSDDITNKTSKSTEHSIEDVTVEDKENSEVLINLEGTSASQEALASTMDVNEIGEGVSSQKESESNTNEDTEVKDVDSDSDEDEEDDEKSKDEKEEEEDDDMSSLFSPEALKRIREGMKK